MTTLDRCEWEIWLFWIIKKEVQAVDVKRCLSAGADIHAVDKDGATPSQLLD